MAVIGAKGGFSGSGINNIEEEEKKRELVCNEVLKKLSKECATEIFRNI